MKTDHIYRPTWVEIDLEALEYNYRRLKNIAGKDVKILSVVKSDAYGHGLTEVSRTLNKCRADYFGVASIGEAIRLRDAHINAPILVFGNISPFHAGAILDYDLTQTIFTKKAAMFLNHTAKKRKRKARVHIKIDTGMGRLGIWHAQAFDFIKEIMRLPFIDIEGVYSHLSSADTDNKFTDRQISHFRNLIKKIQDSNIHIPFFHIANSIGQIDYKHSHFNMVRPGLVIYGIYPTDKMRSKLKLKPIMSFRSKIIYIKRVPKGRSISYGRTFITRRPMTIATIPVGYKDGYSRSLSNKSEVLIRGKRCKVLGRVCMDQMMVDVSNVKRVKHGDIVVLIGNFGKETVSAEEIASLSGTIAYEVVCNIGSSTVRIYKGN